jgi:Raf kinase inhibitor-like YbhB/YbcL family protein
MWWRLWVLAVIVADCCAPAAASTFTLATSAFLNNGNIPKSDAASDHGCGGRNISPPFILIGYPAATRSFALVAFDTDAGGGRGFVHWVAYGIAPRVVSLPPGFGSSPSKAFVGGTNDPGTQLYSGPCPPPGDAPHHYVFTAYALDLDPHALAPGLTRAAFLNAIAGHTLAQAQVIGLYGR